MKWKLKDNIEFDKLKDFNYEEDTDNYIKSMKDGEHEINIDKTNRVIYIYTEISKRYAQEHEIKDLLKSNLVEKVGV